MRPTALAFSPRLRLALAPLLRPQLLDVLWSRNDTTQRPFTEFGGVGSSTSFQPSGETACFLLAGDALGLRAAFAMIEARYPRS